MLITSSKQSVSKLDKTRQFYKTTASSTFHINNSLGRGSTRSTSLIINSNLTEYCLHKCELLKSVLRSKYGWHSNNFVMHFPRSTIKCQGPNARTQTCRLKQRANEKWENFRLGKQVLFQLIS